MRWFLSLSLLFTLSLTVPARAQEPLENPVTHCALPLLRAHGWMFPVSIGPTATLETAKHDLTKYFQRMVVMPWPLEPSIAMEVSGTVARRLRGQSPERAVRVWGRILDAPYAARRTGIAEGIEDGKRGDQLLRFGNMMRFNKDGYLVLLRTLVLEALVQINTVDAWKEIAWAAALSSSESWFDVLQEFLNGASDPARAKQGFQQALAEISDAYRYVHGDFLALAATQRGSAAAAAAEDESDRVLAAIGFVSKNAK